MQNSDSLTSLPPGYNENTLLLLVQSPTVLYAYWDLSGGLKDALNRQENKLLIRLYVGGQGPCGTWDIDIAGKSFYFYDVKPGLTYYCEIGTFGLGDRFYPHLRSNPVTTPHDRPSEDYGTSEDRFYDLPSSFYPSSWTLYKKIGKE